MCLKDLPSFLQLTSFFLSTYWQAPFIQQFWAIPFLEPKHHVLFIHLRLLESVEFSMPVYLVFGTIWWISEEQGLYEWPETKEKGEP